jgi:hypothetical protein
MNPGHDRRTSAKDPSGSLGVLADEYEITMRAELVVILGGIVMAQTASSAWGAEPPSTVAGDLAARVGQPADIASSAYLYRADRKPEEDPPETEFLFAGALKKEFRRLVDILFRHGFLTSNDSRP